MTTFKERCIELRKYNHTLNEIVQITGRPKTSVYFHIQDIKLSKYKTKQIERASANRIINFNKTRRGKSSFGRTYKPFDMWTPPLISLVAHMLFDGRLTRVSCTYYNRNISLIEAFKENMLLVYNFPPKEYVGNFNVLRVEYCNVELCSYLQEKLKILLVEITDMNLNHQRAFLRSFFDDEGSVGFKTKSNKRMVRGYQHSETILILIQRLLLSFDIKSKINKTYNEIVISKKENLIKFRDEINFSQGVRVNGKRSNSVWGKSIEKRKILRMAIDSYVK